MRNLVSDTNVDFVEIVSASTLANVPKFQSEFRSGQPFKNVVIDNFLSPDFAKSLLEQFPRVADPSKLRNEFGGINPKASVDDVAGIGGAYTLIDSYIQTDEFLTLMSEITGIPNLLYDPWYFGAGTHENFHSAGLDPHIDFNIHPKTNWHRRINAIVYLNENWDPKWGGDIGFHTDPWNLSGDKRVSFEPQLNRCVIFETTEKSWHSVEPVNQPEDQRDQSRKSFTIYLYTESREGEEIAPPHGTVYVQRALPIKLEAGAVITASDIAAVNANLERRHSYLKAMYGREYKDSILIEHLKSQLISQKEHSYVPLLGYAKLVSVETPLFTDGWMSDELKFNIRIEKSVTEVIFTYWKPKDDVEFVDIEISIGDLKFVTRGRAGLNRFSHKCVLAHGDHYSVVVTASPTFIPGIDERSLSVTIASMEFRAA